MRFEAEVVSEELLPAVRSIIATELHDDYGLKQKEIAREMELTQPAVSQYINQQRASQEVIQKLQDDPQVMVLLSDAAQNLAQGESCTEDVSEAVRTVRDKGLLKEKFRDAEKL